MSYVKDKNRFENDLKRTNSYDSDNNCGKNFSKGYQQNTSKRCTNYQDKLEKHGERSNHPRYNSRKHISYEYEYSNNYGRNYFDNRYDFYEKPKIIDVFEETDKVIDTIDGVPAKIKFIPNYLSEAESKDMYDWLVDNLDWKQREGVNQSGETYYEPRKTCWFGKPYKYSAVSLEANQNWDGQLENLRCQLSEDEEINNRKEYNSVMCNYYRDNKDSIGWHADDETSLGRHPKIASISLGCTRVFEVCKRKEYYNRSYAKGSQNPVFKGCTILYRFHLTSGSLLIMDGSVQEGWLHRVPREGKNISGRINLTYRHIVNESEEEEEKNRKMFNKNWKDSTAICAKTPDKFEKHGERSYHPRYNSRNDINYEYEYSNNYGRNYFDNRYDFYEKPKIIDVLEEMDEVIETIDGVPAKIKFIPNYLSESDSKDMYDWLVDNLDWKQREGVNQNGEKYYEPRKTCWFGKPYKYSAVSLEANQNWDGRLENLRCQLSEDDKIENRKEYNSVMCNYYRDNKDSIGWHAHDETSLGRHPKIAAIYLGCSRVLDVCKKKYYNRNYVKGSQNPVFKGCTILYRFHLTSGSLLIMDGSVQEGWLHRFPREEKNTGGINLTYLHIVSESEEDQERCRRRSNRKFNKSNDERSRSNKSQIVSEENNHKMENNQTNKEKISYNQSKSSNGSNEIISHEDALKDFERFNLSTRNNR